MNLRIRFALMVIACLGFGISDFLAINEVHDLKQKNNILLQSVSTIIPPVLITPHPIDYTLGPMELGTNSEHHTMQWTSRYGAIMDIPECGDNQNISVNGFKPNGNPDVTCVNPPSFKGDK